VWRILLSIIGSKGTSLSWRFDLLSILGKRIKQESDRQILSNWKICFLKAYFWRCFPNFYFLFHYNLMSLSLMWCQFAAAVLSIKLQRRIEFYSSPPPINIESCWYSPLFLFLWVKASEENRRWEAFHIPSIPSTAVLLDSGWRIMLNLTDIESNGSLNLNWLSPLNLTDLNFKNEYKLYDSINFSSFFLSYGMVTTKVGTRIGNGCMWGYVLLFIQFEYILLGPMIGWKNYLGGSWKLLLRLC